MLLKSPPPLAIFACLILFGLGELAGALLGGYPTPIMNFAADQARARPEVHGLAGIEDIDRTILAKVSSETLSRLHTFHLHGHGVGLLAFVLFTVITNSNFSLRLKRVLVILTCLGMLYPFGWLTLMLAIPFLGMDAAFQLAEKLFFMPFGSALLLTIWLLIYFYGAEILRSYKKTQVTEGL
jgi:hypothetical protein